MRPLCIGTWEWEEQVNAQSGSAGLPVLRPTDMHLILPEVGPVPTQSAVQLLEAVGWRQSHSAITIRTTNRRFGFRVGAMSFAEAHDSLTGHTVAQYFLFLN